MRKRGWVIGELTMSKNRLPSVAVCVGGVLEPVWQVVEVPWAGDGLLAAGAEDFAGVDEGVPCFAESLVLSAVSSACAVGAACAVGEFATIETGPHLVLLGLSATSCAACMWAHAFRAGQVQRHPSAVAVMS